MKQGGDEAEKPRSGEAERRKGKEAERRRGEDVAADTQPDPRLAASSPRRLVAAPPRRLSVVLDVGPAVHQNAGLARYAERLAFHLRRDLAEQVDLTLFYNAHSGHTPPSSLAGLPQQTVTMGQYAWRLSVLASQMLRRPFVEDRLPTGAIYHAAEHLLPHLHRPTVLTVHDLIFERYPQHHTRLNRLFLKVGMPLFVRAADEIIAVSAHTQRDLVELYGAPAEKIHVIHEGIDERFAPIGPPRVAAVRKELGITRPYLLMVGTLEPRKNHVAALRVLARLKAQDYPHCLVIVGGKGWLFDPIQALVGELGLAEDILFAGRVDDDALPALYSGADCLLMPSLYEGFGFPVLEAMACGTPVVCSNRSSLPEVAGDAALLVDPEDVDGLTAAVTRILGDAALACHLRQAGTAQAARFDWTRCAVQTAQIYRHVINTMPTASA